MSEALGMKDGLFGLLLIVAAIGMFIVAEWAEKRIPQGRVLDRQHYVRPLVKQCRSVMNSSA
ncbi:MAG: hypothetical protein MZV63_66905 [Marinilabiliales bacterium]|nr:hypothetical protein [Marinilabiliales bacterium]